MMHGVKAVSLIYLILLTISGFFSALFLLFSIFVSGKTTGLIITFLVFSGFTFLFYKLYSNKNKKTQALDAQNIEDEKSMWLNYAKDNAESLKAYRSEIDSALINYYHFKDGLQSPYFATILPWYLTFDAKLHKERKSSQAAAKIIYDTVVDKGDDGNPDIFQASYSRQTLPRLYKFNKLFFGSYNPTTNTKLILYSIFLVLGLVIYGVPQIFLGPEHDVFMASQNWKDIATPLVWTLTSILIFLLYRSKEFQQRLLTNYGRTVGMFMKLLYIPLIFGFLYFAIHVGAGKALNDAFGKEQTIALVVQKDLDTDKRSGKRNVKAYCVMIKAADVSKLTNEYCLLKEHYDQIPTTAPVMMRFHGTKSFFGFRIDGYYEGILPAKAISL